MASWSPSQSEPLTVSYMCQRQSSSVMLPSAALMPPCAATVCERVGKSLVMQAVLKPSSPTRRAVRKPGTAGADDDRVVLVIGDRVGDDFVAVEEKDRRAAGPASRGRRESVRRIYKVLVITELRIAVITGPSLETLAKKARDAARAPGEINSVHLALLQTITTARTLADPSCTAPPPNSSPTADGPPHSGAAGRA